MVYIRSFLALKTPFLLSLFLVGFSLLLHYSFITPSLALHSFWLSCSLTLKLQQFLITYQEIHILFLILFSTVLLILSIIKPKYASNFMIFIYILIHFWDYWSYLGSNRCSSITYLFLGFVHLLQKLLLVHLQHQERQPS